MAELLAANQITIAKVLDGEKGEMSAEQIAQLNQASSDASQAKSDVANLEIGGRNLLTNPVYFLADGAYSNGITFNRTSNPSAWKIKGTATSTVDRSLIGFTNISTPTDSTLLLKEGQTYTESVKVDGSWADGAYIVVGMSNSSGSWLSEVNLYPNTAKSHTFTATAEQYALRYWTVHIPSGESVDCTVYLKFEFGDKATDWTPAPEDVNAGIANAAKVATNFINYDSTNGLVLGNKESGSWVGYRSQILPDRFNILDESSTVLASFGTTTVIGEEAKANMHLTFNNLSMVDKNGTNLFKVGDNRNADGIATLQWSSPDVPIDTSGSVTITVGNTISSIVSVYVDSVELSSSSYSFSGEEVTINNLTASSTKYIEIIYNTTDSAYYLTFGNRWSSSIIGEYSIAEGKSVTASGFASHAEGLGTKATGAYSHAEGAHTKAKGAYSHAGGYQTVADNSHMTVVGTYNTENSGKAFVVGVGDFINRRDGFTVDWDGNVAVRRSLTLGKALSIANGGTGATTAAAARTNLGVTVANLGLTGAETKKLLWTNASPTSNFAAQTVLNNPTGQLSGYDAVEIVSRFTTSNIGQTVEKCEVGSRVFVEKFYNATSTSAHATIMHRQIDVSSDGVTFADAKTKVVDENTSTTNNSVLIPYKIYGIKVV